MSSPFVTLDSLSYVTPDGRPLFDNLTLAFGPERTGLVGRTGVVFPAIPSATNLALAAQKARGVDSSVFVNQAKAKGGTFLFPITDAAAQVNDIMTSTMQRVFLGQAKAADVFKDANAKVNALFK